MERTPPERIVLEVEKLVSCEELGDEGGDDEGVGVVLQRYGVDG